MRTAQLAHHSVNGNGGSNHMNLETSFNSFFTKFDPFFDSITQSLYTPFPFKTASDSEFYCPLHIDVADKTDSVQVTAECPGMEQKDLDVSLADSVLIIKGEKKSCWNQETNNFYRSERVYGKFERQIPLPFEIEAEKVEASYKNGVLTVTLPKSQEAKTQIKQIVISSE